MPTSPCARPTPAAPVPAALGLVASSRLPTTIEDMASATKDPEPTEKIVITLDESADMHDVSGSMIVEVTREEISPDEHADVNGWTRVGPRASKAQANKMEKQPIITFRKAYARKVTAAATKAARMPHTMPKDKIKVILRPRGGLNISKTPLPTIYATIIQAAKLTKQEAEADTFCPNKEQNIMAISTPDETRAASYARIPSISVNNQVHVVGAYQTAPEWTSK